jgi:hypothetical protein
MSNGRQDRLQRAEDAFDPLPSYADAARAYGRTNTVRFRRRREYQ